MRKLWFVLGIAILWLSPLFAQRTQSDVKVSHIGPRLVGISCRDGADPTVDTELSKRAGMLVVSCGRE